MLYSFSIYLWVFTIYIRGVQLYCGLKSNRVILLLDHPKFWNSGRYGIPDSSLQVDRLLTGFTVKIIGLTVQQIGTTNCSIVFK